MLNRKVWIGICFFLFLAGLFLWIYRSAIMGPDFYREAMSIDSAQSKVLGEELENKILETHNTAVREPKWSIVVSDQQLNGWIKNHLKTKYAKLNPTQIDNLCTNFENEKIHVAFQLKNTFFPGVISISIEPFVTADEKSVGLRLERVKLGLIPLPKKRTIDQITQALAKSDISIAWTNENGNPLGLVSPTFQLDKRLERKLTIQNISFSERNLIVSGLANDLE